MFGSLCIGTPAPGGICGIGAPPETGCCCTGLPYYEYRLEIIQNAYKLWRKYSALVVNSSCLELCFLLSIRRWLLAEGWRLNAVPLQRRLLLLLVCHPTAKLSQSALRPITMLQSQTAIAVLSTCYLRQRQLTITCYTVEQSGGEIGS